VLFPPEHRASKTEAGRHVEELMNVRLPTEGLCVLALPFFDLPLQ
jgi:hypothetical protein